jgi:hypothetical protein
VLKTRPFSETLQKVLGGLIVRLKKDNFDSPLMSERPVNKVTNTKPPQEKSLWSSLLLRLGRGIPKTVARERWHTRSRLRVGGVGGCILLGGGCKGSGGHLHGGGECSAGVGGWSDVSVGVGVASHRIASLHLS